MKDVVILGGAAGMVVMYFHLRQVYPDIRVAVIDERATEDTCTACGDTLPVLRDWDLAPARRFYGVDDGVFRQFLPLFTFPKVKKMLVEKAIAAGLEPAPTFIHPAVQIIPEITVGRGGFIGTGCDIANDAVIGDYVHAGNAVIGHDCVVGDYCTVGTNSALLGFAKLGEGVQVSPGAIVRGHVSVAPWVIIGIHAAVISNVEQEGITVGGVPAREITSATGFR